MKTIISWIVRTLRILLYNTPIKTWWVTRMVYAWVGRLLAGREAFPVVNFHGMKLKTNGSDGVITTALMNGDYEPTSLACFEQMVREAAQCGPCIVVDVGANIGIFSLVAASIDPKRVQVVAFEPNAVSHQLLCENVELNNLSNIVAVHTAIGDASGTVLLDISSHSTAMHSIYGSGPNRVEVPMRSLDDYFDGKDAVPCLIKIDVEGFEPEVLQGMKSLLNTKSLAMLIEFDPDHLKQGGKEPAVFLDELQHQFDYIYCVIEIEPQPLLLSADRTDLRQRLLTVGYNLILIKGTVPVCLST